MEIYVACFDISDDSIRHRVGKLLHRHGERVQKSVFEIAVQDGAELEQLRRQLLQLADDDDNIRFYRLCASCRKGSATLSGEKVACFPAVIIV